MKTVTAKALADLLDGNEYMDEIDPKEAEQAKASGLVIVFGCSDDLMEFRGAIHDEVGCYDGGIAYVTKDGILDNPDCDREACPYFAAARKGATPIKAVWHNNDGPCWTYETDIPHETFKIYDTGELWCVGIVFNMEAIA